jgi:hypothetical protein
MFKIDNSEAPRKASRGVHGEAGWVPISIFRRAGGMHRDWRVRFAGVAEDHVH